MPGTLIDSQNVDLTSVDENNYVQSSNTKCLLMHVKLYKKSEIEY